MRSLTDRVNPEDVAKIHEILDGLSKQEKAKLNLTEIDGERYINHWYVMIAACHIQKAFSDQECRSNSLHISSG